MQTRLSLITIFLVFLLLQGCAAQPTPVLSTSTPTAALPTSTATALPPLSAELMSNAPQQFPPTAPIRIRFTQPMDIASAQPAVFTYPNTNGEIRWNAEQTEVTLQPYTALQAQKTYRVFIHQNLRSQNGTTFAQQPEWTLTAAQPPRVFITQPLITTAQDPTQHTLRPLFLVNFDSEMDISSVQNAISFEPPIAYTLTWDKNSLQIQTQETLRPGTTYRLLISPTARSQFGVQLAKAVSYEYKVPAGLSSVSYTKQTELRFVFNYPIAKSNLTDSLQITDTNGKILNGELHWANPRSAWLTLPEALGYSTVYTVTFNTPLIAADGTLLDIPSPQRVVTPPAVTILRSQINQPLYVSAEKPLSLEFLAPPDRPSIESALRFSPPMTYTLQWRPNSNILDIIPDPQTEPFEEHIVRLETTALLANGHPVLLKPLSVQVITAYLANEDENNADVSFGELGYNLQMLDVNGRRAVRFWFRGKTEHVDFRLYRLSLDQLLSHYNHDLTSISYSEMRVDTTGATLQAQWEQIYNAQDFAVEAIIPPDVPAGLYILQATDEQGLSRELFINLTRYALMLSETPRQLNVWVSNINGKSIPNALIQIYDQNQQKIAEGRTNTEGIYTLNLPANAPQPNLIVAFSSNSLNETDHPETDITLSGLSWNWRNEQFWWQGAWGNAAPVPQFVAGNLYTDRPIYQPGQRVYFKAILRADDDAALSLLPTGTPVRLQIRDPRNNPVNIITTTLNEYGSAAAFIDIAEGAALGYWNVEAQIGKDTITQRFQVEEYTKPQFHLQITPEQTNIVAGQTITLAISAEYYFGQPVTHATLQAEFFQNGGNLYPYGGWDTETTPAIVHRNWYSTDSPTLTLPPTDASGTTRAAITLSKDLLVESSDFGTNGYEEIGIQISARDADGQNVSAMLPLQVWRRAEQIDLQAPHLAQHGQPFTATVQMRDIAGNPIANRTLTLSLRRWNSKTYEYDLIVTQTTQKTNPEGIASFQITPNQSGDYQLRIEGNDAGNQPIHTTTWLYVLSNLPANDPNAPISIHADRETYAPGDIATLYINSNARGNALLAVERGTTRRTQTITLTPPLTQIQLPIQPEDSPNIYVSVYHWQANDTRLPQTIEPDDWSRYEAPNESKLLHATAQLRVPAADKQLQIQLTPQQSISAPRTNLPLRIEIRDSRGQPVQAEFSLALVDESIFALAADISTPLYESFYHPRPHQITLYHSMAIQRTMDLNYGGGGGGDETLPGMVIRHNFLDTALWLPQLRTNQNGILTVTLPLPDNLTEWRVTVKAITRDHQVGEASTNIVTQQPLVIRPAFPQNLVQGDTAPLTALVHNYSDQTQQIRVSLTYTPTNALQLQASPVQTLTLPPGSVQALGWEVQPRAAAPLQIKLHAGALGGLADSVLTALPIEPRAIPQIDHQTGQFINGNAQTALVLPSNTFSGTVSLHLSLYETGMLLDGIEYLTGYPYGCVEQTMSRALPNAVIGRAFTQLGYPVSQQDLTAKINAGLQRLYGLQHDDGGWGWWYDDESQDYQTAWVLFGLSATAEAGYPVSAHAIEKATNWLQDHAQTNMDDATRAFALYSLAYANQPLREQTLQLAERAAELDPFSQAALALTLHRIGETETAQHTLTLLQASAQHTPQKQIYWQMPPSTDAYHAKTMASTLRATAFALSAFAQIQPENPISHSIAAWLIAHKRPQGWGNTNETAFSILALTDYLLAIQRSTPVQANVQIELNEQAIATATLNNDQPRQSIRIPLEQLPQGASIVTLNSDTPNANLYYQIHSQLYFNQPSTPAAGNIQISRAYTDPKTDQPITNLQAGQIVKVTLTIQTPQPTMYLLIEDHLPGGLEAINERLNTSTAQSSSFSPYDDYVLSEYFWQQYGYNYKEIRGTRVTFFITTVPAGGKIITYLARAIHPGEFTALPTECYAMYDETLWGRSESAVLQILPPPMAR